MIETGSPHILLAIEGAVATITVSRPEKLNALTHDMILALERAAHLVDENQHVRACILTGAGEQAFCAGGDIADWSSWSPQQFGLAWVRDGHRAFDALAHMRQPLIAALNGHTLGGGLELAVTADLRIAEEQVKFGLPETGLGIIPGWSGTQRAVERFGAQTVRRMALFGETFDAGKALALGMIDQVVPKGQSRAAAEQCAEQLLVRGPNATQITKLLINAAEDQDRDKAIEALAGFAVAGGGELKEGVAAFKEKRKPVF